MTNENIPELLKSISGENIDSVEKWEKFRRPEIMSLFQEYVYGVRPIERPEDLSFENEKEIHNYNGENIFHKKIKISFSDYSFSVYGYMPEDIKKPIPAIVYAMNETERKNSDLENTGECKYVDIKNITKHGYGVFIMYVRDIVPDWDQKADFKKGIYPVFEKREDRKDNSWATISAWGWGASRVLDYLETQECIDDKKVTVAGFSRGGKTALWAAALDTRFACAISNNSGCTGAAMHRTKVGERVKDINITDWFCQNYHKFNDNEEMLPVDQHMLIAAFAPRCVYVASSSLDEWADPKAERLSCRLASEVYKLYGKTGVVLPDEPVEIDKAYHDGEIGYHVKTGEHSITPYDWELYLDFLDKKIK